jgi:hypothetical protein
MKEKLTQLFPNRPPKSWAPHADGVWISETPEIRIFVVPQEEGFSLSVETFFYKDKVQYCKSSSQGVGTTLQEAKDDLLRDTVKLMSLLM